MKYYGPRQLKKTHNPDSVKDPHKSFTPDNMRYRFDVWKHQYKQEKEHESEEE